MESVERDLARLEELAAIAAELMRQIGCTDPSASGFQALLERSAELSRGLDQLGTRLCQAEAAQRQRGAELLRRSLALNALLRDAVRDRMRSIDVQLARAHAVRASLAEIPQPASTGESCDLRG